MRPNSLFFDRGEQKSVVRAVSLVVTIAFLVMMGYMLIRYKHFAFLLDDALLQTPMFGWLLLIYVALAFLSIYFIRLANCRVKRSPVLWSVAIFLLALFLRALYLLVLRAPAFGGAVFDARNLRALFLADNLSALLLCAISALIAVVVYWIARYIEDGSAPAAGLMLALYPANVLLAQENRMLQFAMLFALFAVLFALVAFSAERRGKAALFSALSALFLALCQSMLETAWLIALEFVIIWTVLLLNSLKVKKELLRLLMIALAFITVLFPLKTLVLESPGWAELDRNLSGAISAGVMQQAREGEAILDQFNWETMQKGYDVQGAPVRLDESITTLWLEKDQALREATSAAAFSASRAEPLGEAVRLLDFFFVAGVLLFAWVGALLRGRGGAGDLILVLLLLWAGAHLFSDRQLITRALAMPILIMLAANGVFAITGTEPRPKERSKYDACLNRGALNLGDIPPNSAQGTCAEAFHPATGGAKQRHYAGGLYAAMEADMARQKQPCEQQGEKQDE